MKISTKGRYALRLMLELAKREGKEPVSVKDISRNQEISDKYLEQIISTLNKAQFVKSIRGSQGGYILAKNPKDYTVGMILRLTEGSLAPVACLDDETNMCERAGECTSLIVWQKLAEAINGVVDNITLADLVEWERERGNNYNI